MNLDTFKNQASSTDSIIEKLYLEDEISDHAYDLLKGIGLSFIECIEYLIKKNEN